ncbi:hypothetical protein RHMOL_Rhmol09G0169700 [Rhododendron molle]|uniref:Uncharacterized protein n=1 Tax=Rhododendron molle TaxID=49168 RepID=A0ACC0MDZ6_RHOML|nr:hypothetical protein RHMOL_Rhmol09G0169700 [Rhododendron molle]
MTSSHFRRKDIISDLPRNIIESILQLMPVRDAARTSILSTKWRYIWTTISQLVLDNQFFEKTLRIKPIVQLELANAVEKILLLRNGPIQKFVLCLPVILFSGRSDIDHWILFLSRNGIKDFTLDNSTNTPYEMHSCIYSCRQLTQLKLINCILNPPRELSGFQNVIELHFGRVAFGKNMLRTLLSRSGLLEMLIIYDCSGIGHLNIHARNLKVFVLARNNGVESLSFVDTPKLWCCSIALGMKMESLLRGKTPSSLDFLADLPRVSNLHLDSFFLELLTADGGLRSHPTRFTLLRSLAFHTMTFSDVVVISCTLLLIQSCPNLTKLYIRFCPTTNTFEEQVVNYLEAPACMDQSEQTLAKLLSVNIDYLRGLKPQLLLIKLLLACSPKLETLFVGLSSQLNESEGFKISKELSQFRRLSPRAAVIY